MAIETNEIKQQEQLLSFTMKNKNGAEVEILNRGATIRAIRVPDREGKIENVVLAFDAIEDYFDNPHYLGATVGRVGGRIGHGAFALDGMNYVLEQNQGPHHIHGGRKGWSSRIWEHQVEGNRLILSLHSPAGENGYPGTVDVTLTFDWSDENVLTLTYEAETTAATPLSPTNHTYFNLTGEAKGTIEQHLLQMDAPCYVPLDEEALPLGELVRVDGTPFDFREKRPLHEVTHAIDEELTLAGNGLDHPFLLKENGRIVLDEPISGRRLTVETSQPGVVVYTGNHLDGDFTVAGRKPTAYLGICFETQGLPDAINQPEFPSVVLRPGEHYRKETLFHFSSID
ncbi:aldose epimerase family protein [Exiguobacterium flavidum]|uniref:aldose epimerase family protein n=1 Tax=Exiguobacterium flavidum TaxID=2184695 RepID=UPI001E363A5D|nr:aldose epimerase family protein [Exiguobacterium flavidum]